MNMKDVVPQALANGVEGVKSALAVLRQKAGEYQAASNNACDTYFAGVTERENAVTSTFCEHAVKPLRTFLSSRTSSCPQRVGTKQGL